MSEKEINRRNVIQLWGNKYGFFLHEVTIKEVEAATGLSYQIVYNKILPILREAGYTVVAERQV